MSSFQSAKFWLVDHLGLAKDALHIYVAMTLFLAAVIVLKWRVGDWRPWLVVLAAALAGEAWDLRDSIVYATPIELRANWHDIWNTCLWPTMLSLLGRTGRLRTSGVERGEQTVE